MKLFIDKFFMVTIVAIMILINRRTELIANNSMTIQGIIFDFGQVITTPTDMARVNRQRAKLSAQIGLDPDDLWPYLFEGEPAMELMTARIDWETFWVRVLEPKGITDPDEIKLFSEAVFEGTEEVNPDINRLIQELHGRYKLAVLSNANWTEDELTAEIAERGGHPELFDTIITSATVGFAKPHPAIFHIALDRLQLRAEECVFTDDLDEFTRAAARLGFHTFTFTTPAEFRRYLIEKGVLP